MNEEGIFDNIQLFRQTPDFFFASRGTGNAMAGQQEEQMSNCGFYSAPEIFCYILTKYCGTEASESKFSLFI